MLSQALKVCSKGLEFHSNRLKIIAENLANASSVAETPADEPYRRKIVVAENRWDTKFGAYMIQTKNIVQDPSPFPQEHRPGHPGADAKGYLKLTNVQSLVEMMDMREASNAHSALVQLYQQENMRIQRTIDVMRTS